MIYLAAMKVEELLKHGGPLPQPSPEQIGDFYVRLGMVVAAWQFVEAHLIHVYSRAVGAKNYMSLTVSFHVPTSFKIRLDMTNEAVKRAAISPELIEEWRKIYKRAVEKGKKRNQFTHSIVIFDPSRAQQNQHLFLCQSVDDPTRFRPGFKPGDIISQSELDDMIKVFAQLQNDLFQFMIKLPAAQDPLAGSSEPTGA